MNAQVDVEKLRRSIEAAMTQDGTNPKRLSKAIGRGETLVRDIIKGRSKNPTIETVRSIADALGRPVEFFLSGTTEAPFNGGNWLPASETIEELLAAVVLSDEGDLEQRAAIRAAAQAVHAALTKLAADPTNEQDRGYLRAVCDDVRQAMTASPIPPYAGKSRTKARKADTRENSQP